MTTMMKAYKRSRVFRIFGFYVAAMTALGTFHQEERFVE